MKVVTAIAKAMKAEGVEILFAYPVNPLIEAAAEEDIRTVIVRQERIGLHMADAYSRMSSGEKFGVFCMQHGPGAENAFGGVAQAFSESSPILVVPGGYPRHLAHYYPNFNSTLNMQHITKWAEPVTSGRAVPDLLRRAFFQLRNGRPGPVLLEVPADLWNEEVPDGWVHVPSFTARSGPDPADVAQAARVLAAARRPVIYAGQGVHYARAWAELKALAEAWNIPVTTSIEGKSAFPENHPLSLGSGGRANPRPVKRFLADADVILGVGCSFALTGFGVGMPAGQDDHPRHPRPDGPEQGRGGAVRPDRRRPAHPDGAEPGDGRPRQVHGGGPAGRPAPRSPGCARPGWRNGRPSWRTTPRRSTPTG